MTHRVPPNSVKSVNLQEMGQGSNLVVWMLWQFLRWASFKGAHPTHHPSRSSPAPIPEASGLPPALTTLHFESHFSADVSMATSGPNTLVFLIINLSRKTCLLPGNLLSPILNNLLFTLPGQGGEKPQKNFQEFNVQKDGKLRDAQGMGWKRANFNLT